MLRRLINGEIALGFLVASLFWIAFLGWATSFAPNNPEKEACYQAAAKSGRSTDECKSFWEKTTSDPVATFTLILAFSTVGLWIATIGLYAAGQDQIRLARDDFNATHRPWIPITNATLSFGLKWIQQRNALIGIDIFCKNTGNSPARRVSLAVEIFPFLINDDIPKEMARIQDTHRTETARQIIEHTLFPGMPGDLCLSRGLLIEEQKLAELKNYLGEPATEMVPVIVGSIEYYFSFGLPVPHYTPFVYHVWGSNAEGIARQAVQLNGKNLEISDLILVPLINAGDPT